MRTCQYVSLALLVTSCGPGAAASDTVTAGTTDSASEVGMVTEAPTEPGSDSMRPTTEGTEGTGTTGTGTTGGEPVGCERLPGSGEVAWYMRCGGEASDYVSGVSVDAMGNIYVGIAMSNFKKEGETAPVMFGSFAVMPGELSDIVIVKLDSEGEALWVRHFTGPGDQTIDVMTGCGDGVVFAGWAEAGTLDLGEGPVEGENYMASLDGAGELRWSRGLPTTGQDASMRVLEMACDAEEKVAMVGYYRGSVDLGGGPMGPPPGVIFDGLVARYDAKGGLMWGRGFESSADSSPNASGVAYAPDGGVVLIGWFNGTINLGGGPLTAVDGDDVLVAKLDAAGEHVWSRQIGPEGLQYGRTVAVDADGKVVIGGSFLEGITIGADNYTNVFPDAVEDIDGTVYDGFLGFWDAMGAPESSLQIGTMLNDEIMSVRFDAQGRLLMGGFTNEAYTLRNYVNGAPGWTWSTDQFTGAYNAIDGDAVVLATSTREAVDLGAGSLAPRGEFDVIVAKIRRGE